MDSTTKIFSLSEKLMLSKHNLLAACYPVFQLKNFVSDRLGFRLKGKLRVLLYHDIAPINYLRFGDQLTHLQKTCSFITPQHFIEILSGVKTIDEPSILLTFDDGFFSNRVVAERILNPLGIKALFFIVSEFAELGSKDDWRGFVSRHIWPGLTESEVPDHWNNMSWRDLEFLLDSGHTIGAHTAHHVRLSKVSGLELEGEIVESADLIENKLGISVEHFAYTFGDLASFSPKALALARQRFQFIYTGLRGNNSLGVPPWAIRRDAINPTDSHALVGAYLEGGADYLYRKSLKTYESWGLS